MRIGPTIYYNCPGCGKVLFHGSILSGNTYGALLYSDTKMIAGMFPIFPTISKCEKCNTIFWVNKLKRIEYVQPNEDIIVGDSKEYYSLVKMDRNDPIFNRLDYSENMREAKFTEKYYARVNEIKENKPVQIRFLGIDDYFNAIQIGIAENNDEIKHIRISIWWAYNDRIRRSTKKKMFESRLDKTRWVDNVKKLIDILDESDIEQKMILAELNRNLGKFKISINILQSIEHEYYNWIKNILIKECESKNKLVVRLIKPADADLQSVST